MASTCYLTKHRLSAQRITRLAQLKFLLLLKGDNKNLYRKHLWDKISQKRVQTFLKVWCLTYTGTPPRTHTVAMQIPLPCTQPSERVGADLVRTRQHSIYNAITRQPPQKHVSAVTASHKLPPAHLRLHAEPAPV